MKKNIIKPKYIILLSLAFGLIAVFFDGVVDSLVFQHESLTDTHIFDVELPELLMRIGLFLLFAVFGITLAIFTRRLQDSNIRFTALSDESPSMIFINKGGRVVYVNPRCEQIMGYKKEEFLSSGFKFLDLVSAEDKDLVRINFEKHMKGEDVEPCDYTFVAKDGTPVESILTTKLIDYQGTKAILGVITDISERKQAEEELKTSEENFRRSMDRNPLGIRIFDSNWKTIYANRTLLDIYGFNNVEEFNTTCEEKVFTPDSYAEHMDRVEGTKRGEHVTSNHEISIVRKDGGIRCLEVIHREILWDHKLRRQMLYRDVTDVRQMQEQLIRQDRLVSLGQLVSGVAHELNNPLTSVIGFSELVLQRDLPQDLKDDLNIINTEAKRTSAIVQNLLTFARQHPKIKMPIDINEPVNTVLQLRKYEQNTGSIKVIVRLSPDLPPVMGNESQLQQVFFNIVTNAEQAMRDAHNGGTLTIVTENKGNFVRASFADDGPGITSENMSRLFSPFFTTKEIGKGTGLGLSISQGIIADHGGKIWAESVAGKGANFIIELPVFRGSGVGTKIKNQR